MVVNKLEKITFSKASETDSSCMVKNFIIRDSNTKTIDMSFGCPFAFEGVVFMICLGGTGKIKISFKEYRIEKDTITIILPNQIVEKIDCSDDYSVNVLAFSPDFLANLPLPKDLDLYRKIAGKPVLKVSAADVQNLLRYYSFIVETFNNSKHQLLKKVIRGLLFSLLIEIMNLYSKNNNVKINDNHSSRSEEIVEHFISLLRDNYKEGRTTSYYADKMCITPKYLSSTLKKVTGRSVSLWIDNAIILGAKLMLKSSNLTILQISEKLNFPNPSYFGRFFKKKTGMTPRHYRES